MYAEKNYDNWQHTAAILNQLVAVNSTDKHRKHNAAKYNPWDQQAYQRRG